MNAEEKSATLETLRAGRDALINALRNVSEDDAATSPGPGKWSMLQCVEHLVLAEDYLFGRISGARRVDAPVVNPNREAAIRARASDRTKKIEAPDVARPSGRFVSLHDALQHFLNSRHRTIEFVERCNEDLRAQLTDHPLLGQVNCYETLLIMAAHPLRHSAQIAEIRATIGR